MKTRRKAEALRKFRKIRITRVQKNRSNELKEEAFISLPPRCTRKRHMRNSKWDKTVRPTIRASVTA